MNKKRNKSVINKKQSKKKRIVSIINILNRLYPDTHTALNYKNVFQLLIAVILSAQCTDTRVNIVTKELFKKYKSPGDFARTPVKKIARDISSINFFNMKARAIHEACARIVEEYDNKVPSTMEELLTLRGVARKTANVVLGDGFGTPVGIVVDTHVIRLSQRLGLTQHKNPVKIELDLMKIIPKKHWRIISHWFMNHGRRVCMARSPRCLECKLFKYCPSGKTFLIKK